MTNEEQLEVIRFCFPELEIFEVLHSGRWRWRLAGSIFNSRGCFDSPVEALANFVYVFTEVYKVR